MEINFGLSVSRLSSKPEKEREREASSVSTTRVPSPALVIDIRDGKTERKERIRELSKSEELTVGWTNNQKPPDPD